MDESVKEDFVFCWWFCFVYGSGGEVDIFYFDDVIVLEMINGL